MAEYVPPDNIPVPGPSPQTYQPRYKMDEGRIRELITPEGINLQVRLADAGDRIVGILLDLLIMFIVLIVFTLGAASISMAEDFVLVIWFLGFFILRNFYFVIFEMGSRAATPGKMIAKTRVAARNGGRLTANMVFGRNALREIEIFLPLSFILSGGAGVEGWVTLLGIIWAGIFLFFPLFNKDRLRAGDLIAGTWVVKAPREILSEDISQRGTIKLSDFIFAEEQLAAYGVHELHVLEDVIRRNDAETVMAVADRIRSKIDWDTSLNESNKEFIEAYYAALRKKLESGLLFGVRKADKFDKT